MKQLPEKILSLPAQAVFLNEKELPSVPTKESFMKIIGSINMITAAVAELQEKVAKMEEKHVNYSDIVGYDISGLPIETQKRLAGKQEPAYTLSQLREKYLNWVERPTTLTNNVDDFLNWLEEQEGK